MSKRVIQISVDIMIDKNDGYDDAMEERIANAIEDIGYSVMGIEFSDDVSGFYEKDCK